jgi:hypothetical protein
MSQNDPLLGNDWLEKEEPISGQLMANGVTINAKNNNNNNDNKSVLTEGNFSNIDINNKNMSHFNDKSIDNRLKTNNKLMSTIAMSESDSSSDDIVIPMQRRKVKHRFTRKRYSIYDKNI